MANINEIENKIALVTGASRGIGSGIAKALAKEAYTVIGTATQEAGAEKITAMLKEQGNRGCGMVLNVTSTESIDSTLKKIKEQFGPINILVNNAAITQDNIFLRMKDEEWRKVIETDLNSIFHLSKLCLKDMLKTRWGRIINIGSVVGSTGNPGQVNYCAAKAGIIGFSKALALEVGSRDITVNTVSPGFIDTDMTQSLTQEQREAISERIPMRRIGSIADVAAAVVFLASPSAGYITGQNLHINGGMFMN